MNADYPLWVVTIIFGSKFRLGGVAPPSSWACLIHEGWSPPTEGIHYQKGSGHGIKKPS